MTITVNTKAYTLDATVDQNQNQYTGPNHTISARDTLSLRRSKSAASVNGPGVAKAFCKFVRTVTVDGKKYDLIAEGYVTAPVGVAQADVDSIRDDLGDLLVSTNGADLVWKQDINQ